MSPPSSVDGKAGAGERDPSIGDLSKALDGAEEGIRQRTCERIERLLNGLGPEARIRLAKELRRKDDPTIQSQDDPIPFLLTILLERRRFSTIVGLTAVHEGLCKDPDWPQADILVEILEEVTPLVIDEGLAREISTKMNVQKSAFFVVPDYYSTTLEILMAQRTGKA